MDLIAFPESPACKKKKKGAKSQIPQTRKGLESKALITNISRVSVPRLSDTNQLDKRLRIKPLNQISLLELSPQHEIVEQSKPLQIVCLGPDSGSSGARPRSELPPPRAGPFLGGCSD